MESLFVLLLCVVCICTINASPVRNHYRKHQEAQSNLDLNVLRDILTKINIVLNSALGTIQYPISEKFNLLETSKVEAQRSIVEGPNTNTDIELNPHFERLSPPNDREGDLTHNRERDGRTSRSWGPVIGLNSNIASANINSPVLEHSGNGDLTETSWLPVSSPQAAKADLNPGVAFGTISGPSFGSFGDPVPAIPKPNSKIQNGFGNFVNSKAQWNSNRAKFQSFSATGFKSAGQFGKIQKHKEHKTGNAWGHIKQQDENAIMADNRNWGIIQPVVTDSSNSNEKTSTISNDMWGSPFSLKTGTKSKATTKAQNIGDNGFGGFSGGFVTNDKDCKDINTKTCSVNKDCSCYGLYRCSAQGRCQLNSGSPQSTTPAPPSGIWGKPFEPSSLGGNVYEDTTSFRDAQQPASNSWGDFGRFIGKK